MNLEQFHPDPLTDCHIHYPHPSQMPGLIQACDELRIERLNIVCTPHRERLSLIPDALHLKAHYPQRVYVFGGLDVSAYFRAPLEAGSLFADSLERLAAAGCDGIKMIEGKPDMRKLLPIPPFDSVILRPFWKKMAQLQVPLLFHVNDPEEFWDAEQVPEWAMQRGWFYGDGTYISNEAQYAEIYHVLAQNPSLKVIFAHFFFLSAQLPRLANLLDRYPNVCIDLTPGIEMYRNFALAVDATREFFLKYQDRILFGTDIGARALLGSPQGEIQLAESRERVRLVRNFLENPGEFQLQPGGGFLFGTQTTPFRGLGLPEAVLKKIYGQNFSRVVAPAPRPVDPGLTIELCRQIETMLQIQGSSQPGTPGDPSVVREVRSYFEALR